MRRTGNFQVLWQATPKDCKAVKAFKFPKNCTAAAQIPLLCLRVKVHLGHQGRVEKTIRGERSVWTTSGGCGHGDSRGGNFLKRLEGNQQNSINRKPTEKLSEYLPARVQIRV